MKNIIIIVLVLIVLALVSIVKSTSNACDFWRYRCLASEQVINQVEEHDEDYVLDVLAETDAYQNWLMLKEK